MKTTVVIILARITVAGEIYSDAALTSGEVSGAAAPDSTVIAVAHGFKSGSGAS
jgi:hypothetical protein